MLHVGPTLSLCDEKSFNENWRKKARLIQFNMPRAEQRKFFNFPPGFRLYISWNPHTHSAPTNPSTPHAHYALVQHIREKRASLYQHYAAHNLNICTITSIAWDPLLLRNRLPMKVVCLLLVCLLSVGRRGYTLCERCIYSSMLFDCVGVEESERSRKEIVCWHTGGIALVFLVFWANKSTVYLFADDDDDWREEMNGETTSLLSRSPSTRSEQALDVHNWTTEVP